MYGTELCMQNEYKPRILDVCENSTLKNSNSSQEIPLRTCRMSDDLFY